MKPYYTIDNYVRILMEPVYRNAFLRTGIYAVIATAISLVISYPVAYYCRGRPSRGGCSS